jgi:hypothetical protein
VVKLLLAFILVCFAVQFLATMAYVLFGLPLGPRGHGQATNDVKQGGGEARRRARPTACSDPARSEWASTPSRPWDRLSRRI